MRDIAIVASCVAVLLAALKFLWPEVMRVLHAVVRGVLWFLENMALQCMILAMVVMLIATIYGAVNSYLKMRKELLRQEMRSIASEVVSEHEQRCPTIEYSPVIQIVKQEAIPVTPVPDARQLRDWVAYSTNNLVQLGQDITNSCYIAPIGGYWYSE